MNTYILTFEVDEQNEIIFTDFQEEYSENVICLSNVFECKIKELVTNDEEYNNLPEIVLSFLEDKNVTLDTNVLVRYVKTVTTDKKTFLTDLSKIQMI